MGEEGRCSGVGMRLKCEEEGGGVGEGMRITHSVQIP